MYFDMVVGLSHKLLFQQDQTFQPSIKRKRVTLFDMSPNPPIQCRLLIIVVNDCKSGGSTCKNLLTANI
ncbi:hypothetical protein Hanom_Chr16g01467321 [Helianthus anomalus]